MADKIKEKGPVRKELKEKVKAAPKELLRRGLSDGTQRLRGQLRDTAQRGQRDDYGGDQIEDTAWRGGRWGERGIEKLLKKVSRSRNADTNSTTPPETQAKPPFGEYTYPDLSDHPAPTDGTEHPRIKTRESAAVRKRDVVPSKGSRVGSSPVPAPQDRVEPPRIRTREAGSSATGISPASTKNIVPSIAERPSECLSIKIKDTITERQATTFPGRPSQAVEQGRQKIQRKQGEKAAARRFEKRQTVSDSPSMPAMGSDKPTVQRSSPWRQIAQSGDSSVFIKDRVASPVVSTEKAVKKAVSTNTKTVKRTAGQAVKTAEQSTKQVLRSTDGLKVAGQTAQATQVARRRAVQALRALRKSPTVTARGAAKAGTAALRATVRAAQTLAAALAAGSSVVVSVILVLCLVGVLVASPFGIFFAGSSSPDTAAPSAAVAQINGELSDYLAALQAGGTYDRTEILGQPPAWSEVFAVFAAKTAGAADGVDVVTLDAARVDLLRVVFWDMTKITTEEETIDHPASGSTPAWSETVLEITITPRTPDDMRVFYSFTDAQNQALDALLANGSLLTTLAGDLTISGQNAKALLAALPADLNPERRAVVETACRLVGKVNYFWGGKSRVIGWDKRWGQIKKVTASGSSTSGTYRPFGLDCSGFVDWVFYNVTGGSYIIGHGGGAHSQHGYCTAITWDQATPGDLVFYPGDTHVGIVGGRDENGDLLIIHCTYSKNNVVITGKSGFTSIARPNYYSE